MQFGIIEFPGSNCDHDAYHVAKHVFDQQTSFIWHKDHSIGDADVVIIPGGFSYGDALRSGAIARFSPIMKDVIRFANNGGLVLGICNGFQILCESGLLPGALMKNASLRFVCKNIFVRPENRTSPFTRTLDSDSVLQIPIAHGEGNYIADDDVLCRLEDENRIAFRYCNDEGEATSESNPNGSARNIAGILNEAGNVLGMMPHPERCAEEILGRSDGAMIFESILVSTGVPV
ncbi:MAG: phosphoribosylformylglycinamidine synthase subunit PurQ [Bacteroidetes bacterium]|nr:phosphoribosylformylglycinamidine synthase subunit PurQ [Bacteroidota bacterium]